MKPVSLSAEGGAFVPAAVQAGHYTADAALVWCFDDRFSSALEAFLNAKKLLHKDLICIAGGLKTLASPDNESDREFVLGQIRASVALHHTPTVYLMAHSDCGKYGGLKAFGDDPKAELAHITDEATRALEYVKEHIPEIEAQAIFADFTGIKSIA